VESNVTSAELTLHARPVLLQTDYALKLESLVIKSVQLHRSLRSHIKSRDPRGATDVDPLIKCIGVGVLAELKSGFIALNEEVVVIRDLAFLFTSLEQELDVIINVFIGFIAVAYFVLVVDLSFENNLKGEGLIFARCKLSFAFDMCGCRGRKGVSLLHLFVRFV
jgi:hypothetical protein